MAAERMLPTRRITTPRGDLSLVLNAFTNPPFEPIHEVSTRFLTLKAVFLVAITSARRVDEISALVHTPPYTQILDDRVILKPDPAFLPKVVLSFHRSQEIVLPSASSAKERVFHTLDVIRALIQYLDQSRDGQRFRSLFIKFSGPNKGDKASKDSIAR